MEELFGFLIVLFLLWSKFSSKKPKRRRRKRKSTHSRNDKTGISFSKRSLKKMAKRSGVNARTMSKAYDELVKEIEDAGGTLDLNADKDKAWDEIASLGECVRRKLKLPIKGGSNHKHLTALEALSDREISYLFECVPFPIGDGSLIPRESDHYYYYKNRKYKRQPANNKFYKLGILTKSRSEDTKSILMFYKVPEIKAIAGLNGVKPKGRKYELINALIAECGSDLIGIEYDKYLRVDIEVQRIIMEAFDLQSTLYGPLLEQNNADAYEAFLRGGSVQHKMWLSQRDIFVCEFCAKLDGEVAAVDDLFSTGELYPTSKHCKRGCRCLMTPFNKNQ
jgi:hypothetical protein